MPVIDPGDPPEGIAGAAKNRDIVHTGNAEIIELGKNPFRLSKMFFHIEALTTLAMVYGMK